MFSFFGEHYCRYPLSYACDNLPGLGHSMYVNFVVRLISRLKPPSYLMISPQFGVSASAGSVLYQYFHIKLFLFEKVYFNVFFPSRTLTLIEKSWNVSHIQCTLTVDFGGEASLRSNDKSPIWCQCISWECIVSNLIRFLCRRVFSDWAIESLVELVLWAHQGVV